MKLHFSFKEAGFNEASDEIKNEIRAAAAGALDDVAKLAVRQGRANIASAGFPGKWQTGFGYAFNKGTNPEVAIFHRFGLASVFERGMSIGGQPMLWLPIEANLPPGIKSPKKYGKKLVSVNIRGKAPLLFDAADRRRGPLFVGVRTVNIRKRFDLRRIITESANQIGEFYQKRIES